MNRFLKLTQTLINNQLWCNEITYIKRNKVVNRN